MKLRIDIVSDIVCPWCYIGKRRLERALAMRPELEATMRWHPFELHPYIPAEGVERRALLDRKFGGERRAKAIFDRIAATGADEGIAFAFAKMPKVPNTVAAHCVLEWAHEAGAETQNTLAERFFAAVFEQGEDMGDHATLARLAGEVGLDAHDVRQRLDAGIDRERVQRQAEEQRHRAIGGVPHIVVNDHFPIPGAQTPETMLYVIDAALKRAG